jgi:hypothetical protein
MDTVAGTRIVVDPHYQGPDGTVNGGWAAGLTAGLLAGGVPVRVTLRAPVPVGVPVDAVIVGDEGVLRAADGTVLTSAVAVPSIAPPPPFVDPAVAAAAGASARNRPDHPFPRCFGCGPARSNGLGIAVGPVPAADRLFADLWTPPQPAGALPARYLWAALDCPTGWVYLVPGSRALLGRLTVAVHGELHGGQRYVVVAQGTGAERRKRFATGALYTEDGVLVASSDAVWIEIN